MSKVYRLLKSFLIFCKIYKYFTTLRCYNNNNDNNNNKSFRPAKAPIFTGKWQESRPLPTLPPPPKKKQGFLGLSLQYNVLIKI